MELQDRHVVVTGGTGALGTAVVARLLDAGALCHVPCRSPAQAAQFLHRDRPGVTLVTVEDLADEAGVDRLYAGLPQLWASIHIAGGFASGPVAGTDKATLQGQLDENLVSCFLCCRAAVKAMPQGAGGRIVNVAARPALEWRSGAGMAAYTASKAAVAALTVALAQEVADKNILVNAIAPSIIDTPANRQAMPKADHAAWPKPEQIAEIICGLASPANLVARGAIVPVYGKV
jgi:NAD(P)-dependent dehydrogenase (short-subunit alcohol dehydrogenase family)